MLDPVRLLLPSVLIANSLLTACSSAGMPSEPVVQASPSTVQSTPAPTTPQPTPTAYRTTQDAGDIALVLKDLPDYLGYRQTSSGAACARAQISCADRSFTSYYYDATAVATQVDVWSDAASASAEFARLESRTPTALAGSRQVTPFSFGTADQSAEFIKTDAAMATTIWLIVRVGNSTHVVGVSGAPTVPKGAALTTFGNELANFAVYALSTQLGHLKDADVGMRAPTPPVDPRHALNFAMTYPNGWRVSVLSVEEQASVGDKGPRIGNRLVTATVMATNTAASGAEGLDMNDFSLVDTSRQGHTPFVLGSTFANGLYYAKLAPGQSVTKTVTFELPIGLGPFVVVYRAGLQNIGVLLPQGPEGYDRVVWKVSN